MAHTTHCNTLVHIWSDTGHTHTHTRTHEVAVNLFSAFYNGSVCCEALLVHGGMQNSFNSLRRLKKCSACVLLTGIVKHI